MSIEDLTELCVIVGGIYIGYALFFSSAEENNVPEAAPDNASVVFVGPQESNSVDTKVPNEQRLPAGENRIQIIEEIAQSVGYDFTSAGAVLNYGCPPGKVCRCSQALCQYGSVTGFVGRQRVDVWIYESAFSSRSRLEYAVLHELAHVWQVEMRGWEGSWRDFSRWTPRGVDPAEATADCLAKIWGADPGRYAYWDCPVEAQSYMRIIYQASIK